MNKNICVVLVTILRILIGGTFILSGILKLIDTAAFEKVVQNLEILPGFFIPIFIILFPFIELLSGISLAFGIYIDAAAFIIMLMLVGFIAVIISNMHQADAIGECGCFGSILQSRMGWELLIRDIGLLICTILVYQADPAKNKTQVKEDYSNLN